MIESDLLALTGGVNLCALRIRLDTGPVRATVPTLRGVWGCALRRIDPPIYRMVFEGATTGVGRAEGGRTVLPLYVMRPAAANPDFAPAVELLLLGEACTHVAVLLEAFRQAGTAGLGPKRVPFQIQKVCGLLPDGTPVDTPQVWAAREAAICRSRKMTHRTGLCLAFDAPLRILRHGVLIHAPSCADIAIAGLRRLCALSAVSVAVDFQARVLDAARGLPGCQWRGWRQDLVRWSGRQKDRIEMRGVTGRLDVPGGVGPLLPLLAALEWIHVGKGTVFGLGQLTLAERAG